MGKDYRKSKNRTCYLFFRGKRACKPHFPPFGGWTSAFSKKCKVKPELLAKLKRIVYLCTDFVRFVAQNGGIICHFAVLNAYLHAFLPSWEPKTGGSKALERSFVYFMPIQMTH